MCAYSDKASVFYLNMQLLTWLEIACHGRENLIKVRAGESALVIIRVNLELGLSLRNLT